MTPNVKVTCFHSFYWILGSFVSPQGFFRLINTKNPCLWYTYIIYRFCWSKVPERCHIVLQWVTVKVGHVFHLRHIFEGFLLKSWKTNEKEKQSVSEQRVPWMTNINVYSSLKGSRCKCKSYAWVVVITK